MHERAIAIACEVGDCTQAAHAVSTTLGEFGGIDVPITNAPGGNVTLKAPDSEVPDKDTGRAVLSLVSDDIQYLTGATLMLDGGQVLLR